MRSIDGIPRTIVLVIEQGFAAFQLRRLRQLGHGPVCSRPLAATGLHHRAGFVGAVNSGLANGAATGADADRPFLARERFTALDAFFTPASFTLAQHVARLLALSSMRSW